VEGLAVSELDSADEAANKLAARLELSETVTPPELTVSIGTVGSLTPLSTETAAATMFGFGWIP